MLLKAVAAALAVISLAAATVSAQPPVTVSPNLVFADQPIYTNSSPRTVTVSNLQNVALNFSSIQVVGDFVQSNTCGGSIPGNSTCIVTVLFQPKALGVRTGTLRLTDDASNDPQAVTLSGVGIPASVMTYHYNNARTGADSSETILTPANVNVNQFGKLFSLSVDAGILAQPLYISDLQIPGLGTHNVIYVATQHNSLYAFDADNGATLWSVNLGPYQPNPQNCLSPGDVGIAGTPVIDPSSNTLYAVAATIRGGVPQHELHAIDISTGLERSYSPKYITATASGTGPGSTGGSIGFVHDAEFQRPALLLDNRAVYVGFGSYCDFGEAEGARGWLMAYNVPGLQPISSFVVTPNGSLGAIWESGGGPAADANHSVYITTGNGLFDIDQGGPDYGDSVIKLASRTLARLDYFTPFDQATLDTQDEDLGSGGITLLPDQATSPIHVMVTGDKRGRIYSMNRDSLGRYNSSVDQIVQEQPGTNGQFGTPTFWNNTLYYVSAADYPKAFSLSNGRIPNSPSSQAAVMYRYPGSITVVSANRQTDGILWAVQRSGPAPSGIYVLHAYNARNLAQELYNSNQAGTRDVPGVVGKNFESIIVANGKVYLPTGQPGLAVFGLLPLN
jgi:hypothetical protein